MKFFAIAAALISFVPGILAVLVINTPSGVVQCQPILLTYGAGTPPYYLSVLPGGQVSGTPLHVWDPTNAESMTWNVDITAGTPISLSIKDNTGAQAYSDQVIIQPGSDSSCLNGANAAAAGNNSAATRAASSGASAAAAATNSASRAASPSATPATPTNSRTAATQSASSNAASGASTPVTGGVTRLASAAYGVGGAVGLVGALLL